MRLAPGVDHRLEKFAKGRGGGRRQRHQCHDSSVVASSAGGTSSPSRKGCGAPGQETATATTDEERKSNRRRHKARPTRLKRRPCFCAMRRVSGRRQTATYVAKAAVGRVWSATFVAKVPSRRGPGDRRCPRIHLCCRLRRGRLRCGAQSHGAFKPAQTAH